MYLINLLLINFSYHNVAYNTDIEQVGSITFSIISDFLTSQPAQSPAAA